MALTRIDSYLVDLDSLGGVNFDVQSGVPTFKVDAITHRVGVGTASPGRILECKPSASLATLGFETGTINSDSVRLSAGGTTNTYLEYRGYLGHAWFVQETERLRLNSSGNLGLGVTPSAWALGTRGVAFELQDTASAVLGVAGIPGLGTEVVRNAVYGSGGWVYKVAGPASRFFQGGGAFQWFTAPSGFGVGTAATSLTSAQNGNSYTIVTAGNTDFTLIGAVNNNVGTTFTKSGGTGAGTGTVSQNITFTQAMTLDANGRLALGTTEPNGLIFGLGPTTSQKNGINYVNSSPYTYTDIWGAGTSGGWAGQIRFWTSNNAVPSTPTMTLDESGRLGVKVVPSAWNSTYEVIQFGARGSVLNTGGFVLIANNFYEDSSGVPRYLVNAEASYAAQVNGVHRWHTAPSGTAGPTTSITSSRSYTVTTLGSTTLAQWQTYFSGLSALPSVGQTITSTNTGTLAGGATVTQVASLTQAMTLDANGNLGLGTTSLDLVGSTTSLTLDRASGNGQLSLAANGTVRGRIFADNGSSELRIGNPTANPVTFFTANTTRLTLDAFGNLGLGVVPSAWGANFRGFQVSPTVSIAADVNNGTGWFGTNWYQSGAGGGTSRFIEGGFALLYRQNKGGGAHEWLTASGGTAGATTSITNGRIYTVTTLGSTTLGQWQTYFSGLSALPSVGQTITATNTGTLAGGGIVTEVINFTQAMTLDANGNLFIRATSNPYGLATGGIMLGGGVGGELGVVNDAPVNIGTAAFWKRVNGAGNLHTFSVGGTTVTTVGSISTNGTSTTYATTSDYRLKENIAPVNDGIMRLQQLKPSRFNFLSNPKRVVDGFIAHEVQAVVPEAITGEKDAVDDDGKPVYQGIDQSKLVPLLTAALQEAIAKIESLESRLTAAGI